jgi:hypothetical protein
MKQRRRICFSAARRSSQWRPRCSAPFQAGFSPVRYFIAVAQPSTFLMRPRRRLAVSGLFTQMGFITFSTSSTVISSTAGRTDD